MDNSHVKKNSNFSSRIYYKQVTRDYESHGILQHFERDLKGKFNHGMLVTSRRIYVQLFHMTKIIQHQITFTLYHITTHWEILIPSSIKGMKTQTPLSNIPLQK